MAEKNDDVSIESIKVKMAGETKTLTIEQARKLRDALLQLFPAPYVPSICCRPHADEWRGYPWKPWITFCDSSVGIASTSGYAQMADTKWPPETNYSVAMIDLTN